MSDPKPWWRRWDGMPPSWDHRRAMPLGPVHIWFVRATWAALLTVGSYGATQGWSWAIGWLVMFGFQLLLTPARQRRQILGRSPRET